MIIDMHCHILPGIDDGARDEGSMERMFRIADAEGIDAIVATPHYTLGQDEEELEAIKIKYDLARKAWIKRGSQKQLYLGSELLWEDGMVEALDSGKALTMNGTSYVLVEFLPDAGAMYIENAMRRLQYAGYIPIIAHVDRYIRPFKTYGIPEQLGRMPVLVQANASFFLNSISHRNSLPFTSYIYIMF